MSFESSLFFITLPFLMILGAFIVDKSSKSDRDAHETGGDDKKLSSALNSLREEMKKKLSDLESKWSTWTPITSDFMNISASFPGKPSIIDLATLNIPDTALQVLVYVQATTSWITDYEGSAKIELYSDPKHPLEMYVYARKQSANSYNSENVWLPIGEKRNVTGRYIGQSISEHINIHFKIIGYR